MPISPLFAAYIGFVGFSLGALALIMSLRTRYMCKGRCMRVIVYALVTISLVVVPLVVIHLSSTVKAILTADSEVLTGGT
jgi:hypothetical protein